MNRIEECTQALIAAIRESGEYVRLSELRDAVKEQPELRREINDFRFHVFEVQNSKDPLDIYGDQERLCRDFEEFRKTPLVNEFLEAELRLCRVLQGVTTQIAGAIDLDVEEVAQRIEL